MLPLSLSLLLGWTEVVKTQSRRQSGLVCSLLVVSLLLSPAVGEECVQGMLPAGTVNMYGPSSRSAELSLSFKNVLYAFPSMNFSCNGTITDIRIRMGFMRQPPGISQEVVVYFFLFHDRLSSPTRRVSYILLNQTNTQQEFPNQIWNNSNPLSLPVTEGIFIGFAVPTHKSSTILSRNIYLSQKSKRIEAEVYPLEGSSGFDERVLLEAARRANSSQFTPQTNAPPLIDIIFRSSPSLTPMPPTSEATPNVSSHLVFRPSPGPSRPTPTPPPSEATPSMPSQLVTIVTAVVTSTVLLVGGLLVVVVIVVVVVVVVVVHKRQCKDDNNFELAGYWKDRATNGSPGGSEQVGSPEAFQSPTSGQLKQTAGDDKTIYAAPTTTKKEETSGCKDEQAMYASTEGLSVHYAQSSMNPELSHAESQHYEFPSTESEHYWCPADNEADLYEQLSHHKYQETPRSAVIQKGQIGEGEFGVVYQGEWQNMAGVVQQVAIKMLHNEDNKVKFLQEVAAMGQFNHSHVVQLFGVVTMGKPVMIVLELLEKGDLHSYLLRVDPSKHPNPTPLLLRFSRQIADGMAHLSSKDFIHRDLATRNILLDGQLNCKIADFGLSRDLTNEYYLSQGGRIPLKWTAPEALLYNKYSTGSDVWSYGMVLFEIWSLGHKPFEEKTARQLVHMFSSRNGYCQPPPPGCPREVYAVMVQCWNPDYHKRPRFEEVFAFLSRPEPILTSFAEELDLESVPPAALALGSPLDAAKHLYLDLQHTYTKKK